MHEIFSGICLFLFLGMPLVSSIEMLVRQRSKPKNWVIRALIVSGICYVVMIFVVEFENRNLQNQVTQFDLNGDGEYSPEETTPEMEQAMKQYTNDTGRSLAPIAGLIISPMYSAFWHALFAIPYFLIRSIRSREQKV